MRSDCLMECLEKKIGCPKDQLVISSYLMTKDYFQYNKQFSTDQCSRVKDVYEFSNEFECLQVCRKDCMFTYFETKVETRHRGSARIPYEVEIRPSILPVILITHLPEITFNAFV